MADKIKITKDDITTGNVELPDGYKIEKFKTKDEISAENLAAANELEASLGEEPSDDELIIEGKMCHPYYTTLKEIEHLRK